jgi:hypothetical protein
LWVCHADLRFPYVRGYYHAQHYCRLQINLSR